MSYPSERLKASVKPRTYVSRLAKDPPISGATLGDRIRVAQERRWPYVKDFAQRTQSANDTHTKPPSQSERRYCALQNVICSDLVNSRIRPFDVSEVLAEDISTHGPWNFETQLRMYSTEADLERPCVTVIAALEDYLYIPLDIEPLATGRPNPPSPRHSAQIHPFHLFYLGRKVVVQQRQKQGSRADVALHLELLDQEECYAYLRDNGYPTPGSGQWNNGKPRTNPPEWFRGRIFNCKLETTSSLKTAVPLIAQLDERGIRLLASSASSTNKDHSMYIKLAYQMQTFRTEWATLECPDFIVILHVRESEEYETLYVDGPYRRHESVPQPLNCGRQLDVFTLEDYVKFMARAWLHAVDLETRRAKTHPEQSWPDDVSGSEGDTSQDARQASRMHGRAGSSVGFLANMRQRWSKLADSKFTLGLVNAMRKWCAGVALNSCTKFVYHNRDGGEIVSHRTGDALLPHSGLLESLTRRVLPREIHFSWKDSQRLPEGRMAQCERVRFWGHTFILKYNRQDAPADTPNVVAEYDALRQKRKGNAEQFDTLPIPAYYGLFCDEWNADDSHTIIMSDNGDPVDWDEELADQFRGDHRGVEVTKGIACLRKAGFPARDHGDFHNVLYDGKTITFCDFCDD